METLRTLPGDDVRQIMWRYADRFDLQMAVQSARSVARGVVAYDDAELAGIIGRSTPELPVELRRPAVHADDLVAI